MCGVKIWRGYPHDPLTGELLTERSFMWRAEISGEGVSWEDVIITFEANNDDLPIVKGEPIDEAEYRFYCESAKWAKAHKPDAPEANPRKPINHLKTAPIF